MSRRAGGHVVEKKAMAGGKLGEKGGNIVCTTLKGRGY